MIRGRWQMLGPSLVLAAGIIVATLVAVMTSRSGWMVLAAPLLLALSVVVADVLNARLQGAPPRPSWTAVILGASFLLAGALVALTDPKFVQVLIPIIGAGGSTILVTRPYDRGKRCEG